MAQETPPTNSGNQHAATDLAILNHVALYRLTFTHPVQRLFFPEEQFDNREAALSRAGDALAALAKQGLLTSRQEGKHLAFNKDHKYFILTEQGAELVGAPQSRTESPSRISEELAVLWFCTMGKKRFHRVERDELAQILGNDNPHHLVRHAIADEEFGPVLYRVCPTQAKPANFRGYAKKLLTDVRKNQTLLPMSEVGDYGFAILTPSEEYREAIQRELRKPDGKKVSLNRQARFTVRLGPTPRSLDRAIKGQKPKPTIEEKAVEESID